MTFFFAQHKKKSYLKWYIFQSNTIRIKYIKVLLWYWNKKIILSVEKVWLYFYCHLKSLPLLTFLLVTVRFEVFGLNFFSFLLLGFGSKILKFNIKFLHYCNTREKVSVVGIRNFWIINIAKFETRFVKFVIN